MRVLLNRFSLLMCALCALTLSSSCFSQSPDPVRIGTEPEQSATVGFWAIGGGFTDAGLLGRYFADPDFGEEVFQRRDIRLDFDWGDTQRPGGSQPDMREHRVGTDNYSIRWEGRLASRFSETYTLHAEADSVRVWLRPEGATDWGVPLIEHWPAQERMQTLTGSRAFTAGEPVEIRVDYRERSGPANMTLRWSSPSTPLEVIQPLAMNGTQPPGRGVLVADALYASTNWGALTEREKPLEFCAGGWPTRDFSFVLRPIDPDFQHGTYLLTFRGSAAVRIHINAAEFFSADGQTSFGERTRPENGYDPASNTTTLRVNIAHARGNCWPNFSDSDRDGPQGQAFAPNSGVTDIRMMLPVTPGADEPHGLDEFFLRDAISALGDTFVTLRWNDVNGNADYGNVRSGEPSGRWEDRRPFFYRGRNLVDPRGRSVSYTNENHEYKILLNNRLGRDLYIQVPHFADDAYILNMARLIRHGANREGVPYGQPTADPFFPPLNANLRVNLEFSNETPWNTAGQYPQGGWMRDEPERLRQAWLADPDSPDGRRFAILNYDKRFDATQSVAGFDAGKRFFALRTLEMSNLFRQVFGDEAMPAPGRNDPRIRPLLMYQYDNANNTARDPLFFLDNYFNKTDPASTYAGEARPVSWFLYGGGAATYYASEDAIGLDTSHPLTAEGIGGFESPVLPDGVAVLAPANSPWTFEGSAGIVARAARAEGAFGEIPAPAKGVDAYDLRGFTFTVGEQPVAVYELGRHVHANNSGNHVLYIMDAESGETLVSQTVSLRGAQPGETVWVRTGQTIFVMAGKSYNWPLILQPGKTYHVVSSEDANSPHTGPMPITPPSGIRIDGAVAIRGKRQGWSVVYDGARRESSPNHTYGPVNLRVSAAPQQSADGSLVLGWTQDSRDGIPNRSRSLEDKYMSRQNLFLRGQSSASIEFEVAEPGIYAMVYSLAHLRDQRPWAPTPQNQLVNPIRIFADLGEGEQSITPSSQTDIRPNTDAWGHSGYWAKPEIGFDFFGSVPFTTTRPGQRVRVRFAGDSRHESAVALLDNIQLASSARMTAGRIPGGGGFAEGAPDVSNWEARVMSMYRYVQTFGLKAISYEGGWYPGGDANKMPLQFQSSFFDERMVTGERNAVEAMARAGMSLNTDYSRDFAIPDYDFANAARYSRIRAWRELNNELPQEATNGLPLLSTLTHTSVSWSHLQEGPTLQPGGWMSWNVVAPATGRYSFRVESTPGGRIEVRVNEHQPVVAGDSGGVLENREGVFLTKGLHNIRVRAAGAAFDLLSIACAAPGQAYGLAGLEGQSAYRSVLLTWPAVEGAEGYNLLFKTRTETEWRRYNEHPLTVSGVPYRVRGLAPDVTHNFIVTTVAKGQESAYSNQVTAVPLVEAELLAWRFDNELGRAVHAVTRRDLLLRETTMDLQGAKASGNGHYGRQAMGTELVITRGVPDEDVYFRLVAAPEEGASLMLKRLDVGVYSSSPEERDPRKQLGFRVEIRWSTDGFQTYERAPVTPEISKGYANGNTNSGVPFTADLSGIPALQDARGPVEFRIYLFGELGLYHGLGKRGNAWDAALIGGVNEP
jgi:hypothetical protein